MKKEKNISDKIIALIEQARQTVAKNVNSAMVFTYYHIGKILVEEWQQGEKKAEYGTQLIANVSANLTKTFGRGFSVDNLERMRKFFLLYSNFSKELRNSDVFQKSATLLRISGEESDVLFLPISWSHYSFLMRIKNDIEKQFYEIRATFQKNRKN